MGLLLLLELRMVIEEEKLMGVLLLRLCLIEL